jgi:hypothetical protein
MSKRQRTPTKKLARTLSGMSIEEPQTNELIELPVAEVAGRVQSKRMWHRFFKEHCKVYL